MTATLLRRQAQLLRAAHTRYQQGLINEEQLHTLIVNIAHL